MLREVEPGGHLPRRERVEELRMRRVKPIDDRRVAAARLEHVVEQDDDARHHHERAARIRERDGAEAADARIEHDDEPEKHEPRLVAVPRRRRKETRAAHKLRRHRPAEKEHDHERREHREAVRLEPRADDVNDRHRVELAREQRHALAEDAEHEEDRRDLHDRHVDPAEAHLPRHAGPADERAH